MNVKIYSDGSARGNPGNGGYGTIIVFEDIEDDLTSGTPSKVNLVRYIPDTIYTTNDNTIEISAGYKRTTNNRMELLGAIRGLETLVFPSTVDLYSDSQYLVKAFNDGWIWSWIKKKWKKADGSAVKNVDLWKRLLELTRIHQVNFHWVKGHDGHEFNESCDKLATDAAENNATLEDSEFIEKEED